MNLPEFTENVNIHQSLPDQPTLTPTELKIKWDEGVSKIKNYINEILLESIKTGTEEDIKIARENLESLMEETFKDFSESMTEELNTFKNDLTAEVDSKISTLEKQVANVAGKVGADVTRLYLNDDLGNKTGTLSSAYTNYNLLLIVGRNMSNNKSSIVIPTSRITTAFNYELLIGLGDFDVNLQIHFDSTTKFTSKCSPDSSSSQVGIVEVYGIGKK